MTYRLNARLSAAVNHFRAASRSRFVRNVAVLSGGQSIAMLIPLLAAPILGRLYLPSDYGVFGAYLAISSVLATVGNLQFSQGVITEQSESKARVLQRLCVFVSFVTAGFAAAVGLAIYLYPAAGSQSERLWFLFLPVSCLVAGISTARNALATRLGEYQWIACIQVVSASVTVSLSIAFGLAGHGCTGLFIAYFASQTAVFAMYAVLRRRLAKHGSRTGISRILAMARKHKNFAIFSTPSAFAGNLSMQMPVYALGMAGSTEMIGLFNRARQLLGLPIALVGGSISQVFLQQASADYAEEGNCRNIFRRTLVSLLMIGVLPTIFLAAAAPFLFEVMLGPNWRSAGEVARIVSPMLFLRFVCSPLSSVFLIAGAQSEQFVLTVLTACSTAVFVFIPLWASWDPISIPAGFSIAYSITYLLFIARGYRHSLGLA